MEYIDYNKPWYRIENEGGIVAEGNGTINEWVIQEWAGLNKMPSYPTWDESIKLKTELKDKLKELTWDEDIHTGSWRGLCSKCGKRQCYYHAPTNKLFDLCAVCGLEAIDTFLKTPTPVTGTDYDESAYCGNPSAYTSDISVDKGDEGDE